MDCLSYRNGQAEQDRYMTEYEVFKITNGLDNMCMQQLHYFYRCISADRHQQPERPLVWNNLDISNVLKSALFWKGLLCQVVRCWPIPGEQNSQADSCCGIYRQSLGLTVKVLLCQELKMGAFILLNKLANECNL